MDRLDEDHISQMAAGLRRAGKAPKTISNSELSDHAERYRYYYTVETPKGWLHGVSAHRHILEAVERREVGPAASRLARHYSSIVLGLIAALAPEHDPHVIRTAARMAGCYERSLTDGPDDR